MISALRARCERLTSTPVGLVELAFGANHVGLWEQWTPEPTTGCYLWTGDFINTGYGTVALCGVRMLVHRIVHTTREGIKVTKLKKPTDESGEAGNELDD